MTIMVKDKGYKEIQSESARDRDRQEAEKRGVGERGSRNEIGK